MTGAEPKTADEIERSPGFVLCMAVVWSLACGALTLWQGFRYERERQQFVDCVTIGHMDPQDCKDAMGM